MRAASFSDRSRRFVDLTPHGQGVRIANGKRKKAAVIKQAADCSIAVTIVLGSSMEKIIWKIGVLAIAALAVVAYYSLDEASAFFARPELWSYVYEGSVIRPADHLYPAGRALMETYSDLR